MNIYDTSELVAKSNTGNEFSLPNEHIIFKTGDVTPLVLTKEGFVYNGKTIEDAGEAYRLFKEFLEKSMNVLPV